MNPLSSYILMGGMAVSIGLGTWVMLLRNENRALESELSSEKAKYANCSARTENINEDKKSDSTVTDPGTFTPPDGWFLPNPDADSGPG